MNLLESFGYCIIPKGTLLYRGHASKLHEDYMFFALKAFMASSDSKQIQVWKTIQDIKVIFLIESIGEVAWATSAIPKLYSMFFHEESTNEYDDLSIKRNIGKFDQFWRKLYYEHGIPGFFTSYENNAQLEICLFDQMANKNHIELFDTTTLDSEIYFKDSLRKIEVFPTTEFYQLSKNRIMEFAPYGTNSDKSYKEYLKSENYCNKEEAEGDKKWLAILKEQGYNLRLKLKI